MSVYQASGLLAEAVSDFPTSSYMSTYYDLEQRRFGITTGVVSNEFPGMFPAAFPLTQWNWQLQRYIGYWRLFTGAVWEETLGVNDDGNPTLKYPLKLNYIQTYAMKRAAILFGEIDDGCTPLVRIKAEARPALGEDMPDDSLKKIALQAEQFCNQVLIDNNARSAQMESGVIQQFLGGAVFKIGWNPDNDNLEAGITYEQVIPDFFMPVWNAQRPDELLEAFVVYRITAREAELMYDLDPLEGAFGLYMEHWTKDKVNITINSHPITVKVDNTTILYDNVDNPFGFVPFVYIPTARAGSYYGISMCETVGGLVRELNGRLADIGDLIHETSHRELFISNVIAPLNTRHISTGRDVIDLGVTPSVSKDPPTAFKIDPPTLGPQILAYPDALIEELRNATFLTPVSFGEDEGGERSAKTLAARMWPATSNIKTQRSYWSNGMKQIAKMILKIAIIKGVGGITQKHLKGINFGAQWFPMMPTDEAAEVETTAKKIAMGAMAPQTAMKVLSTTDNPDEEMKRIQEAVQMQNPGVAQGAGSNQDPATKENIDKTYNGSDSPSAN